MSNYELYTDGSCKGNGREDAVGAYGYVLLRDGALVKEYVEAVRGTTNNRMELLGVIEGIRALLSLQLDSAPQYIFNTCTIHTDSAYIINCYTGKWYMNWRNNGWVNSAREPVKNKDLWEKLIIYFDDFRFKWKKVKGHANNKWNNYVDEMVQSAALDLIAQGGNNAHSNS